MKYLLSLLLLFISVQGYSQTQAEMNESAYAEYRQSDKQLNHIYQTILSKYKSDKTFINNLKKSQRLWLKFRDAEMAMKYPNYANNKYGSVQPTCDAIYLKHLTDQRISTLQTWVSGIEEGEVCCGSVKVIEKTDPNSINKLTIKNDGSLFLHSDIKKDHRIFAYQFPDINSRKMFVLSVFTPDVKGNQLNYQYGAYYDTNGMRNKGIKLKYVNTDDDFVKVHVIKNKKVIDTVYMLKKWFEM